MLTSFPSPEFSRPVLQYLTNPFPFIPCPFILVALVLGLPAPTCLLPAPACLLPVSHHFQLITELLQLCLLSSVFGSFPCCLTLNRCDRMNWPVIVPADEASSVEEVEEALWVILCLVSQCQESDIKHKEASLLLALMEFSSKPGLARQLPGVAEKFTITLANLRRASLQPPSLQSAPRPANLQLVGFHHATNQPAMRSIRLGVVNLQPDACLSYLPQSH